MAKVYLAGPIAHLSYEDATSWRRDAASFLKSHGITALSPMRAKEFLGETDVIGVGQFAEPLADDAGIVARDRMDVMASDLILVNFLNAPKVSVGTAAEFGWADAYRKPIVTVMPDTGSPYEHPFIRQLTSFRLNNMRDALELVVAVLKT